MSSCLLVADSNELRPQEDESREVDDSTSVPLVQSVVEFDGNELVSKLWSSRDEAYL